MGLLVYRDRRSGKELVGRIDFQHGKYARFEYDTAFVQRSLGKGELGISERLPLAIAPYEDSEIAPFFQGLLPEGAVLSELSSAYQVAPNDYFSLIEKLGCESCCDCIRRTSARHLDWRRASNTNQRASTQAISSTPPIFSETP